MFNGMRLCAQRAQWVSQLRWLTLTNPHTPSPHVPLEPKHPRAISWVVRLFSWVAFSLLCCYGPAGLAAVLAPTGYGSSAVWLNSSPKDPIWMPGWTPLEACQTWYPSTAYVEERPTSAYAEWIENYNGKNYYLKYNATKVYYCHKADGRSAGPSSAGIAAYCFGGFPRGNPPTILALPPVLRHP